MFRSWVMYSLCFLCISTVCFACECIARERACENLDHEAVFVGRVITTQQAKHQEEKNSYTLGYSMRFAVDESLIGGLGTEVTIETGSGGGDCGTPLAPGEKFLIFAYKAKDGKLWTGMCSGNRRLSNAPEDLVMLEQYRTLVKNGGGSIFGHLVREEPLWTNDKVSDDADPTPVSDTVVYAKADGFSTFTKTTGDGTYEFKGLPNGKYLIVPEVSVGWDYDHENFEERYQADIRNGRCASINFTLQPATRIRGHLTLPAGFASRTIEVDAIPTILKETNELSGIWSFTDENDRFDLWPLPPGDYYLGVNINGSPKADAPFPPTYYPGVTTKSAASVVHVEKGEVKELELPLAELATPRIIHFVAIGLDGKPMKTIYIQLEDLRHPGDVGSYVNVDLDNSGAGELTVYAGYSYHLHGSHWVSYGNDWCSKPVLIPAGSEPLKVRFVMDRKDTGCEISEIDALRK